jgi:hypothetical protein
MIDAPPSTSNALIIPAAVAVRSETFAKGQHSISNHSLIPPHHHFSFFANPL